MKKILLTMFCAMTSMFTMAQTVPFEDDLTVTINENSTEPQKTTVYLTLNEDGTCNFALNNFMLGSEGSDQIPVGNIFIENLPLTLSEDGYYTISYDNILLISAGDAEGFSEEDWIGPNLGEIPLKLAGKVTMEKLYVTIDIDMMDTALQQIIFVTFGSDFGANAIKNVKTEKAAKTYDLQGRVVSAPARHGIYVVNGKKVVK